MSFFDSLQALSPGAMLCLLIALFFAFAFEFINGFHDTANAVATVIYTRTLKAVPAVLYSGVMNFLGVILGGTAVAFGIVNLLPVELLHDRESNAALVMVLSLLVAGVIWNLGTWYLGLPVSSSHTLIGSILGVGLANSLASGQGLNGINWSKTMEVGLALLVSPLFGFLAAGGLLLLMKLLVRDQRLYQPPHHDDHPPGWIRAVLLATCGGVSFAHGSNDGQKGMGLILLVLIGFMPFTYALNTSKGDLAAQCHEAVAKVEQTAKKHELKVPEKLAEQLSTIRAITENHDNFNELEAEDRWKVRVALFKATKDLPKLASDGEAAKELKGLVKTFKTSIEFVPLWVVIGTALALGIGTTVGYKRIVITIAEKIGKTHLTYAQGAMAELVASTTITVAAYTGMPVSTTHVLSSGVAGTMAANGSGVQVQTVKRIGLAWLLTLPACMLMSGLFFMVGRALVP